MNIIKKINAYIYIYIYKFTFYYHNIIRSKKMLIYNKIKYNFIINLNLWWINKKGNIKKPNILKKNM